MPIVHLTDLTIPKLALPSKGQAFYRDDTLAGFGVRVSHGGTRTFVLMHGEARTLTTIGRVGIITLAKARARARELLAAETLGIEPERGSQLVSEGLEVFLAAYRQKNRASTAEEQERLLRRHLTLAKPLGLVTMDDVTRLVDAIAAPSARLHAFVAMRTFFNWCVRRRLIQASPMAGLDRPHRPQARERVLTLAELRAIWSASEGTYGDILKLLMLSGQRLAQIVRLEGRFVDRAQQRITWPGSHMKGGEPHTIPYGAVAKYIIDGCYRDGLLFRNEAGDEFTSFSTSHRALTQHLSLPHWTRHDLRRSLVSHWAAPPMRVSPHVVEALVDHKTGVVSGVTAIYLRYGYLEEITEAMQRWEEHLLGT